MSRQKCNLAQVTIVFRRRTSDGWEHRRFASFDLAMPVIRREVVIERIRLELRKLLYD